MIKVMIADDQELIRESLQVVLNLNEDIKVTGIAKNGAELLELVKKDVPDVVLMDVRMPEMDGVVATREIKALCPDVKIIILTTFDDDEYVYNALKYGAGGYLLKGVSVPELVESIRKVASGGSILNPDVMNKVLKIFNHMAQLNSLTGDEGGQVRISDKPTSDKDGGRVSLKICSTDDGAQTAEELSRTERKVARLVGNGRSNKEIAEILSITSGTVRNNISSALSKLSLRDRTQLAIWAVHTGLAAGEDDYR